MAVENDAQSTHDKIKASATSTVAPPVSIEEDSDPDFDDLDGWSCMLVS